MSQRFESRIADAFTGQAKACASLGSDFTALLCDVIANRGLPHGVVRERIANWPGNVDGRSDSVPLRLAGALHNLVLLNEDEDLAAHYPLRGADAVADADKLHAAISKAVLAHAHTINRFLDSAPQTNETARSAILLPGFLLIAELADKPFVLSEVGASAGLNQNWDRYHYDYGLWSWGDAASKVSINCDWRGQIQPPAPRTIDMRERRGCDLAPVPIQTDLDKIRLQSYVWADQTIRFERLIGALAIAGEHPPQIDGQTAADWLDDRLVRTRPGAWHVIYHTIMWQYMPRSEQERGRRIIKEAGLRATSDAPLAWLRLEADEASPGAALSLTTWSGSPQDGETQIIARADFHGRWIDWLGADLAHRRRTDDMDP